MFKFWKRKPVVGIGIGVSLVGAIAVAARYGFRRIPRERIPDDISPAIFATRVTETIYGEMIYHVSGTGDPVVFLHGIYLGASSYEWSKVYPHFTIGWEVIVPDLIGFGESERPGVTMDATDYCESLVEFLRSTLRRSHAVHCRKRIDGRHSSAVGFAPSGTCSAIDSPAANGT